MKPDQERVRSLLIDTVTLLCKNGLAFSGSLKIQGLLGVTIDDNDIFIVQIDETFANEAEAALGGSNGPLIIAPQDGMETSSRRVTPAGSSKRSFGRVGGSGTGGVVKKSKKAGIEHSRQQASTDWAEQDTPKRIKQEKLPDESHFIMSCVEDRGIAGDEVGGEGDEIGGEEADNTTPLVWDAVGDTLVSTHSSKVPSGSGDGHRKSKGSSAAGLMMPQKVEKDQGEWTEGGDEGEREESEETITLDDYSGSDNPEYSAGGFPWKQDRTPSNRSNRSALDRQYACQYEGCDKAFYRKDHLVRHQRSMHGKPYGVSFQAQFICHIRDCQKVFYRTQTLTKHMMEVHGEMPDETIVV